MKVAVTGAAGYLGLNVVEALLDEGNEVIAIDRVADAPREGVTWVLGDVLDEDAMATAFAGCELVFHLVAVISLRQEDPVAWRVNALGPGVVGRAALRAGVRRLVSCSSLAAFDYQRGALVDESAPRATDPGLPVYHRSKFEGEVELRRVVDAGLDALVCNPTGVYGALDHPGRLSRMNQGLLDAATGRMPASVTGSFDMVDVRDVARGFLLAAEKGRTGENYLLGGHRHPLAQAQRDCAALLGGRGPRVDIPIGLLERVAPLVDPIARRFGSEAFSPAGIGNIAAAPVVDHGKAARELGYRPRPVADTLADLSSFFVASDLVRAARR